MIDSALRILIVDDEAAARERLRDLLQCRFHLNVVGEADCVATAAALCQDLRPNLIFLDVQMPRGDGFSLLSKIEPLPAVIFVTAYNEYAIRAFEVNAVDYLLKPINADRLASALQRVIHAPPATQTLPFRANDRVILSDEKKTRVILVSEINGIKADENYTDVMISDGTTFCVRRSISEWISRLPTPLFLSPHRSLIVNLNAVTDVVFESRNEVKFKLMKYAEVFSLGRDAGARLRRALRHFHRQ